MRGCPPAPPRARVHPACTHLHPVSHSSCSGLLSGAVITTSCRLAQLHALSTRRLDCAAAGVRGRVRAYMRTFQPAWRKQLAKLGTGLPGGTLPPTHAATRTPALTVGGSTRAARVMRMQRDTSSSSRLRRAGGGGGGGAVGRARAGQRLVCEWCESRGLCMAVENGRTNTPLGRSSAGGCGLLHAQCPTPPAHLRLTLGAARKARMPSALMREHPASTSTCERVHVPRRRGSQRTTHSHHARNATATTRHARSSRAYLQPRPLTAGAALRLRPQARSHQRSGNGGVRARAARRGSAACGRGCSAGGAASRGSRSRRGSRR